MQNKNHSYWIILVILSCVLSLAPLESFAKRTRNVVTDITKSPRYASIVVNADTGAVLHKYDHDKLLHPASLTKMMTLYLTFQAIDAKVLNLNKRLQVSRWAASQIRTNLNLKAGQTIDVRDAIYGVIIHSANDAAVVLAEAIAGSEEAFANRMTKTANLLGMHDTTFKNANGIHHPHQLTTAADMAKLGIALRRDFPKYYGMFSKRSFIFRGTVITGHNRILSKYRWADGLKTGFINASGFNVVSSASRPEGRIVAVVMGGQSAAIRDKHMISLLDKGFDGLSKKSMTPFLGREDGVAANAISNIDAFDNYHESAFEIANLDADENYDVRNYSATTISALPGTTKITKNAPNLTSKKTVAKQASLRKNVTAQKAINTLNTKNSKVKYTARQKVSSSVPKKKRHTKK